MFEKFLTKDNITTVVIIAALVIYFLISTNIFATRLQVSELRAEVLQQEIKLREYSDSQDKVLLDKIDAKYDKIMQKLDNLKYAN